MSSPHQGVAPRAVTARHKAVPFDGHTPACQQHAKRRSVPLPPPDGHTPPVPQRKTPPVHSLDRKSAPFPSPDAKKPPPPPPTFSSQKKSPPLPSMVPKGPPLPPPLTPPKVSAPPIPLPERKRDSRVISQESLGKKRTPPISPCDSMSSNPELNGPSYDFSESPYGTLKLESPFRNKEKTQETSLGRRKPPEPPANDNKQRSPIEEPQYAVVVKKKDRQKCATFPKQEPQHASKQTAQDSQYATVTKKSGMKSKTMDTSSDEDLQDNTLTKQTSLETSFVDSRRQMDDDSQDSTLTKQTVPHESPYATVQDSRDCQSDFHPTRPSTQHVQESPYAPTSIRTKEESAPVLPSKRKGQDLSEPPSPTPSEESPYAIVGQPANQDPYGSRHIPVETWLGALDLMQYQQLFRSFKGVEDLLTLTEADIRDLGVKNQAHRAHMVSTLTLYKDKLNKKMNRGTPSKPSTPRSGTPPTLDSLLLPSALNQPDYATVQAPNVPQFTAANVAQVLMGNLRDHPTMKELAQFAWYHGAIPRQAAEQLLSKEGQFLVRDSTSKPGDFVLTAFWNGAPLHFVVNKRVTATLPNSPPVIEYQFEEDLFDRPTQLILHYLDNTRPITQLSGAIISSPVMRSVPLEFYDPRPPSPLQGRSPRSSPWTSPGPSPLSSPLAQRKVGRSQRAGSQPFLSMDDGNGADPGNGRKASMPALLQKFSTPPPANTTSPASVNRNMSSPKPERHVPIHNRTGSEPTISGARTLPASLLSRGDSEEGLSKPPPKPSRVPTIKKLSVDKRPVIQVRNKDLYDDDKDYSDYDQIKSWPAALQRSEDDAKAKSQSVHQDILRNSNKPNLSMYDTPKNPFRNAKFMYDTPKNVREAVSDNSQRQYTLPDMNAPSSFDLNRYDSELLTPNNKPLEPSAVTTIKSLLLDSSPKFMAQHLTFLDLELLKVTGYHDLGLGVTSGLELMTLPQGHRLRQDIIDRYHSLGLFVGLTILMCSHPGDRTQMLQQWIQIAMELRGSLGNMYSFSAIMAGIAAKQVLRLSETWALLKLRYAESFFMYDQRLTSLCQALDNASATLPLQNITVPHVIPLARLLERDFSDVSSLMTWEEDRVDFGLDTALAHLDTIRIVTQQSELYRATAESVMRDFRPRRDLADMFRTEMHLKLLWGSRGAGVNMTERLNKFPAVLDLLSERVEPGPAAGSQS